MREFWVAYPARYPYSYIRCRDKQSLKRKYAVVAQLVEHHLAKVDVASSSLVNRSTESPEVRLGAFALPAEVARLFWRGGRPVETKLADMKPTCGCETSGGCRDAGMGELGAVILCWSILRRSSLYWLASPSRGAYLEWVS